MDGRSKQFTNNVGVMVSFCSGAPFRHSPIIMFSCLYAFYHHLHKIDKFLFLYNYLQQFWRLIRSFQHLKQQLNLLLVMFLQLAHCFLISLYLFVQLEALDGGGD